MFAARLKVLERITPQGQHNAECPHNVSPKQAAHASAGGRHSASRLYQHAGTLREHGYPPRHYFPREDVRMDLLTVSETTTYCPFKGHTVYFSLGERRDIAWSYEEPIEGMEAVAGRVAFYGEIGE
ncbi:DUF427 domain-containing protein [Vreelandella stevensii]|uniref:DUF427 domain-containing protein n=1 Tax=Vreelandella stevensii TaxID=502821 RepID=UPI0037493CE9